jgi:hypothetical protein
LPTSPVLVVHGFAWAVPDDVVEVHLNGVRNAAAAGWKLLQGPPEEDLGVQRETATLTQSKLP